MSSSSSRRVHAAGTSTGARNISEVAFGKPTFVYDFLLTTSYLLLTTYY